VQRQRNEVRDCAARRTREGPWASQGAATANGCQSRGLEEDVKAGRQRSERTKDAEQLLY